MSFEKLPDNLGMIYIPESKLKNKNPCQDCFSCQWCCKERCRLCRENAPLKKKNISRNQPLT